MKLCIIANPNSVHVRRWLKYFAPRHDVYLFGVQPPKSPPIEGVNFHDLTALTNTPKIRYIVWSVSIKRLIAQIKPDVVHAHWISGAGWIGAASGFHPFLVTIHGSDLMILPKQSQMARLLAKWVLGRADYVTCVSEKLYQEALTYGVDDNRLELVRLGVDTSIFQPISNRQSLRLELGLKGEHIIASIRAIRPVYNPIDIALSIPLILEQKPGAQFIVLTYNASPESLSQFKSTVRAGGAEEAVTYIGELGDDIAISQIYQAADVCISIASSEGTPISVQEAMACGAPVVLGDIPTLQEWVRNGEEALFVPLNDVEELSKAVVDLLDDLNLSHHLSLAGRWYVNKHADSKIWLKRGEEVYQMLVNEIPSSSEHGY